MLPLGLWASLQPGTPEIRPDRTDVHRKKKWVLVPQASPEFRKHEFIICDLVQAPNGDIYYGTYPGAHLVRYDPRAKTVTDLGKVAEENYVRWLAVTHHGIVLCGVGPRHGRVIAYNPNTRAFRTITPKEYQTPGVFSKPLVSDQYVVEGQNRPGGRVLVYDPVSFKLLHVYSVPQKNNGLGNQSIFTVIDSNHVLYQDNDLKLMSLSLTNGERTVLFASPGTAANNRWYFDERGNILGLLVQSYVYLNRKTGTVTHRPIPVTGLGDSVLWLNSSPDGRIYGGPGLGQTFFSFDPKQNLLTSYDQVIDRTGEIYYGIPYEGRLYTMSYAEAGLAVFDPARPWTPGESTTSNPRTILHIPDDQYRPVGGIHLGPGGKMYIGKWPYWPVSVSTPSQLMQTLDEAQIDRAAICSTRSLFVNWEDGNQETAAAIKVQSPRLISFACLGPLELSHEFMQKDFDFSVCEARGFRGVRLYPQHHTYQPLYEPFVKQIAEQSAARRWPVLLPLRVIMNWGVPSIDLGSMVALVERHPQTSWILAGINYFQELRAAVSLMQRYSSVYLETSCIQGFHAIQKLVEECGSSQLLFGSGAPLQHAGASVEKILRARISDSERETILGGNARRVLRLTEL